MGEGDVASLPRASRHSKEMCIPREMRPRVHDTQTQTGRRHARAHRRNHARSRTREQTTSRRAARAFRRISRAVSPAPSLPPHPPPPRRATRSPKAAACHPSASPLPPGACPSAKAARSIACFLSSSSAKVVASHRDLFLSSDKTSEHKTLTRCNQPEPLHKPPMALTVNATISTSPFPRIPIHDSPFTSSSPCCRLTLFQQLCKR